MKKLRVLMTLFLATLALDTTSAASLARGEWESTARVQTPQGMHVMRQMICRQGEGVGQLLLHQQGQACGPWNVSSGSGGQYDVRGTCTQSGSFPGGPLKLRVHAMLTVAANGRSVSGTVQVVGHVAGTSFQSPPTRFSSRYIGACKGR